MKIQNVKSSHSPVTNNHEPAFFQLYLPEKNSKSLRIPLPFIKNFDGSIPQKISLINLSGRIWPAKLEFPHNKLHITRGWRRYVTDQKLKRGDFVVLKYLLNSTFIVMAYGTNGCIKEEPEDEKLNETVLAVGRYSDVAPANKIRFEKTFAANFKNFVSMPRHVLEECAFTLPQSIMLKNDKGLGVRTQLRVTSDRIVIGYSGLPKFWGMIGVQKGDKLEFEVICGNGNMIKEIIITNISQSKELRRAY